MSDQLEELLNNDENPSPDAPIASLKRSTLSNSSKPSDPQKTYKGNDDDSESDSNEYDNEYDSPLQKFLQEREDSNLQETADSKYQQQSADEIPVPNTRDTKQYSLEPDMLFGWKPKYIPQVPVPLKFYSDMVEDIVSALCETSEKNSYPELVYQGFRPENTFFMHEKFSTSEAYSIKFSSFLMSKHSLFCKITSDGPINPPRPFLGMKKGAREDCLVFDSIFEHGNLDTVIRKSASEYDLYLRVDSNTRGHTNWYYFTVKNMKKGQTVKFNILNFSKSKSLYQRGKRPYIHSQKLFENKKVEWQQAGENISYGPSQISYFNEIFEEPNQKKYYKLSFEYTFEYDDDIVSFALCIPYSYARLIQFIQSLIDAQFSEGKANYLYTSKLCYSLGGISVPLLTITDPDESEIPIIKRQYIIMTGRVHPGESNSSWMIQGFISDLLKDKPESQHLRKHYIFKIIPMLNPDGVIVGNHRTGMCGNDLNRQFVSPKEVLHPTLIALREMVKEIVAEKREVFAYVDFHGHSLKKNVFMYGAEFPVYDPNYYKIKIFPKLLSKRTPMFRFQSCLFTVSKPKMTTARAVFSTQFGVNNFYTLEASYANYMDANRETISFDANGFIAMGRAVLDAFYDYRRLLDEDEAAAAAMLAKSKRDDALKIRPAKSEVEEVHLEKSMSRVRFVLEKPQEEKASARGFVDSLTPKNSLDLDKRKTNKRFRIRKGKTLESEGTLGTYADISFESPAKSRPEISPTAKERIYPREMEESPAPSMKFRDEPATMKPKDEVRPRGGLWSLMEEIKSDMANRKQEDRAESDSFSEGGSDSEALEDDFNGEDMKKLQKNIIVKAEKFIDICRNGDKYGLAQLKEKKLKKMNTTTSSTKLLVKEKHNKSAKFLTKKPFDLSPKEKKVCEVIRSNIIPRQSVLNLQSASEKITNSASNRSRSMASQKRGDFTMRTTQQIKSKISLPPKELQMDPEGPGTVIQIKNQLSTFYLGSLGGSKKEEAQRNMISAQSSRKKAETMSNLQKTNEEIGQRTDPSPDQKKPMLYEPAKIIHMSGQMSKQYQRLARSPLDAFFSGKGRDLEILTDGLENFVSLQLDKGFKGSPAFAKFRTPKAVCSTAEQDSTKESFASAYTFKPRLLQKNHINQPLQGTESPEGECIQPNGRSPSRGRTGFTGPTMATAQVYSSHKPELGPVGLAPLKKDSKLPVSFEAYKKMIHSRRKVSLRGSKNNFERQKMFETEGGF